MVRDRKSKFLIMSHWEGEDWTELIEDRFKNFNLILMNDNDLLPISVWELWKNKLLKTDSTK